MAGPETANPDPATDTPPRPRRWIPVSVRLLVLLIPFLGIVGYTWIAVRAYTNAAVINEIERLGGEVSTRPCTPEWLQQQASGDWIMLLDDVVTVRLGYARVTDAWLARLTGLTSLEDLWLYGPLITDAGLEHLKFFRNLRHLGLEHTLVTDVGIEQLSGMTNLEFLSLSGTKVSDASLVHLSRLHNLQTLHLEYTDVTDDGLVHLKGLTNLKTLRVAILPSETEDRIAELQRVLPGLTIENDLFIHSSYWPPRGHSPLFFASGALLMTGTVVVWLLGLAYVLPQAFVKLSAWFTGWCGDRAEPRFPRLAPGALSVGSPRWLRYSRATGVLLVLAAAFLVAVPIVRHQMAVHAIERLGGSFENRVRYPEGQTDLPVSGLQPLDRLINVQELSLFRSSISDRDLAHLNRLPTLQVLWLNDTAISDAALVHIRGLADLRELHLRNTRVTDAGLPTLKNFGRLNELDLSNTPITDAGMVHLAELSSLKDLRLSNSALTDAGLSHLSGLTALTWLDLEGTGVTDSGLLHLAKLTDLKYLRLAHMPHVTGKGLVHLTVLKTLESLSLDGKQFAQARVESLQQLTNLKSLSLANAQMTDADLDDLKRVLLDVFVHLEK